MLLKMITNCSFTQGLPLNFLTAAQATREISVPIELKSEEQFEVTDLNTASKFLEQPLSPFSDLFASEHFKMPLFMVSALNHLGDMFSFSPIPGDYTTSARISAAYICYKRLHSQVCICYLMSVDAARCKIIAKNYFLSRMWTC